MIAGELTAATAVFGFALWLGLYLIARDARNAALRLAGGGIAAYALVWALDALARIPADGVRSPRFEGLRWMLQFLPALLWTGALILLVPETAPFRAPLHRMWRGIAPTFVIAAGMVIGLGWRHTGLVALGFALLVLMPLFLATLLVWRAAPAIRPRRTASVLLISALFFALSTTLLLVPPDWLPRLWALLLVGVDVLFLGFVIAVLDAFDQGEALLPDIVASLDAACVGAVLFGGQVALVMALATGPTRPLAALLLATVATAIAASVFADTLRGAVDRFALGRFPRVRRERSDLRAAASALPRVAALDLDTLDEAEFARLTRRALSHFGDLPRLSASPLTRLPLVSCRLAARNAPDDALERATELKALLAESIARLKPRAGGDFGASDEWRHYNALYFPYVAGLKPYSRRADGDHHDPAARAALEWFRASVPERTLYNWQTAAARLVAEDLRGRNGEARG